ncbi:MAG: hypothetical protein V1706_16220 [Pseudomonadota bacterium]
MSERESKQIIDRAYPRGAVLQCGLVFIAGLIATAAVFFFMMRQSIGPTYGEGFRMLARLDEDIFYKSLLLYGSTVLVALACILVITVLYSHRVAGPVYRLRIFARQIRDGEVGKRVALRRTDVVQPLADEMNFMVDGFHSTFDKISMELNTLEQYSKKLITEREKEKENLQEIEKISGRISSMLDKYKL